MVLLIFRLVSRVRVSREHVIPKCIFVSVFSPADRAFHHVAFHRASRTDVVADWDNREGLFVRVSKLIRPRRSQLAAGRVLVEENGDLLPHRHCEKKRTEFHFLCGMFRLSIKTSVVYSYE